MVTLDQAIKVRNKILEKTVERRYLEHTDLENKKNRLYGITKHGGSLHPEKSRPKKLEHEYVSALFFCGWIDAFNKKQKDIKKSVKSC